MDDQSISILHDKHFSVRQQSALADFIAADPTLVSVRATTADGQELLVFRESHPDYKPEFVAKVRAQRSPEV